MKGQRLARAMRLLIAIAATGALLACQGRVARDSLAPIGIGKPQIVRLRARPGADYPPRPAGYPIRLFQGDVQEPYEAIGTAQSRSWRESEVEVMGAGDLQQGARSLGGDAVINVAKTPQLTEEVGYRPGALMRSGAEFVTHYVLSGTVVRFVRHAPAVRIGPADAPESQVLAPSSAPAR